MLPGLTSVNYKRGVGVGGRGGGGVVGVGGCGGGGGMRAVAMEVMCPREPLINAPLERFSVSLEFNFIWKFCIASFMRWTIPTAVGYCRCYWPRIDPVKKCFECAKITCNVVCNRNQWVLLVYVAGLRLRVDLSLPVEWAKRRADNGPIAYFIDQ